MPFNKSGNSNLCSGGSDAIRGKSHDEATRMAAKGDVAEAKHGILKWVLSIALAQAALIISFAPAFSQNTTFQNQDKGRRP